MLGNIGHFGIVVSFVAICVTIYGYWRCHQDGQQDSIWLKFSRITYGVHAGGIITALLSLFLILFHRQYQYAYAWDHASNDLPLHFIISCFWEGQEGSFLIWIFWNAVIGLLLIKYAKSWEPSVLMVFGSVQLFLISMVLGVVPLGDLKIGSSPFLLLSERSKQVIFLENPGFVPLDGNGLNPLLQNIWMVIHPPIIFLGFSIGAVPFAFALSGLLKKNGFEWVEKCFPWLLGAVGILGLGIMMGAYWAYETLNFGGYWNWDPVENAVLIPWLVMVAGLHGVLVYKKLGKGLRMTAGLILSSFVLVIYSTFLTRSGILGDASVHSFTDLGLSGQLLIFLGVTVIASGYGCIRSRTLFTETHNSANNQIEWWLMIGISTLLLSAFQILAPTSIPVVNALLGSIGIESDMAPPSDPAGFYAGFQLWFALGFGISCGVCQIVYSKGLTKLKDMEHELFKPLLLALLGTTLIILFAGVDNWKYILLIGSSLFGLLSGLSVIWKSLSKNWKTLGGPITHAGFAVLLIGVVFSAGYQKVITQNLQINAPESSLPIHTIQENTLLNRNQPSFIGDYQFEFASVRKENQANDQLVDADLLLNTNFELTKVLKDRFEVDGSIVGKKGDTIQIEEENTYYEIQVADGTQSFTMFPRMQNNPSMGYVASPAIHSFWDKDVYLHITNFPNPDKIAWTDPVEHQIAAYGVLDYRGLNITYKGSQLVKEASGVAMNPDDVAISSLFQVQDQKSVYEISALTLIRDGKVRYYPEEIKALGLMLHVSGHLLDQNAVQLTISHSQRDWVTIKAIEMPHINLVWTGTLIMVFGIGLSVYRRIATMASAHNWQIFVNAKPTKQKLKEEVVFLGNAK